jgi:hypothetical protein
VSACYQPALFANVVAAFLSAGPVPQAVVSAAEDKMVEVGDATVLSGTFYVMARHPLKYNFGWHQYSYFADGTTSKSYEIYKHSMKLPDHVHKFDFVGDAKHPF